MVYTLFDHILLGGFFKPGKILFGFGRIYLKSIRDLSGQSLIHNAPSWIKLKFCY